MKFLLLPFIFISLTIRAQNIFIRNATIVDIHTGQLLENTDLQIEKNRIKAIGKNLQPGNGDIIIDASNKYLIPGLWDMHAHLLGRWDKAAPLYVVNGVTGVRDMANPISLSDAKTLRQNVFNGKIIGPRFITSARLLDGPQSRFPRVAILIPTKDYAIKVADSLKQEGVDFYKVYETLPRDAFYAIIEKGKEYHLSVTGHVPSSIGLDEAIKAGMKGIEHLKSVRITNIPPELRDSLRGIFQRAMWDVANKDTAAAIKKNELGARMSIQYFTQDDAIAVGKLLAENKIWITPTMVQSTRSYHEKKELLESKSWDYMPASITSGWRHRVENDIKLMRFDIPDYVNTVELKTVEGFYKSGVKFLAGTDANDAFIGNVPGFSVHEEMQLFTKVGMSNLEALQTATLNPAVFMESTDSLGSIEKNKIADILILDANPLENISNTRKIFGVIFNGYYYDRKKLDQVLEEVKVLVRTK